MSEKEEEKEKEKKQTDKQGEEKGNKDEDKQNRQKQQRKPAPRNQFTPSENQGDDKKPGNEGDEQGRKDVKSFEKKGENQEGESPISNLNLKGRSVTALPSIKKETQKQGKVVVEITVNQEGKVIKAEAGKRGTTVTSLRLKQIARKAALETRFNSMQDGPSRQVGTMTINFKLQ